MNKRIIYEENGIAKIVIPSPNFNGTIEELGGRTVPINIQYEIVNDTDIPADRTFRNAWKHDTTAEPKKISIDMIIAKEIAHNYRRKQRERLLAPLDVQATIPSQANAAEIARQEIRDNDATKQVAIDAAITDDELKTILGL